LPDTKALPKPQNPKTPLLIYLILSITAMSALACVFRMAASAGVNPAGYNAWFRIWGGVIMVAVSAGAVDWSQAGSLFRAAGPLSMVAAVFFWAGGYSALKIVVYGPLGVSWAVLRCSMIVGTLASIFWWREVTPETPLLFAARLGGVALIVLAVIFLTRQHADRPERPLATWDRPKWIFWLCVTFCSQGGWEVCLRATKDCLPDDKSRVFFLTLVFALAGLASLPLLRFPKVRSGRKEILCGLLAAAVSAVGSGLRPWAIRDLGGVIVFPATTISVMLLVQAASFVFWRERIHRVLGPLAFGAAIGGIALIVAKF